MKQLHKQGLTRLVNPEWKLEPTCSTKTPRFSITFDFRDFWRLNWMQYMKSPSNHQRSVFHFVIIIGKVNENWEVPCSKSQQLWDKYSTVHLKSFKMSSKKMIHLSFKASMNQIFNSKEYSVFFIFNRGGWSELKDYIFSVSLQLYNLKI